MSKTRQIWHLFLKRIKGKLFNFVIAIVLVAILWLIGVPKEQAKSWIEYFAIFGFVVLVVAIAMNYYYTRVTRRLINNSKQRSRDIDDIRKSLDALSMNMDKKHNDV